MVRLEIKSNLIDKFLDWWFGPGWEANLCGKRNFKDWTNYEYWCRGYKEYYDEHGNYVRTAYRSDAVGLF